MAGPYIQVTKTGAGSGEVESNIGDIDCGLDCFSNYSVGDTVTLTATPDGGSVFAGWGGACAGERECVVIVSGQHTVYAAFLRDEPRLSTIPIGSGGGRVVGGKVIDCSTAAGASTCVATFESGSTFELKAHPDPGSEFAGWGGDAPEACVTGQSSSCLITMTQHLSITATFVSPCPDNDIDCGPNPPQMATFVRPTDSQFLAAAGITAPDAIVVSAANARLPETGRTLWCARVVQVHQTGGQQVCLEPSGLVRDVRLDVAAERAAIYRRRGSLSPRLFEYLKTADEPTFIDVSIWVHADPLADYPVEPECEANEPCPREAARVADLTWRTAAVIAAIYAAGGDPKDFTPDLPMLRARIAVGDVYKLKFNPLIHLIDQPATWEPASSVADLMCRMHTDEIREYPIPAKGAGTTIGLHELAEPDDTSNLALAATYAYGPVTAAQNPLAPPHARKMAYLIRNTFGDKLGFAPDASVALASSQHPQASIPWLMLQRTQLLAFGSVEPYSPDPAMPESVGQRGPTSLLLDYLPLIAHRPLVLAPAGNAAGPTPIWCTPVSHPLYNAAVVGGVTIPVTATCSTAPTTPPLSASEGNPLGTIFANHWELPTVLAPNRNIVTQAESAPLEGTSYATAIAASTAATTIEGFKRASPSGKLAPETLRAILMAAQPDVVATHGLNECGDAKHNMAQLLDAEASFKLANSARIPIGNSTAVPQGYDLQGVAAGSFSNCRPLGTAPNPQTSCDHVAGPWRMSSHGGPGRVLRIATAWSHSVTCKARVTCIPNPANPGLCTHPFTYSCVEPARPLDLGLEVRRGGNLVATSILFEGTAEAVEVDASVAGDYEARLTIWDPQSPKDTTRVGIAWWLLRR